MFGDNEDIAFDCIHTHIKPSILTNERNLRFKIASSGGKMRLAFISSLQNWDFVEV